MLGLTYMQFEGIKDMGISEQGHTFVTMVVSFLLVSRVTMALARYSEARNQIGAMFRGARKLD
jgi:predicted membrane chloride channel (bestrophin family)